MKIVLFFNLRNKLAFGLCFQSLQAFLYVKVEVAFRHTSDGVSKPFDLKPMIIWSSLTCN